MRLSHVKLFIVIGSSKQQHSDSVILTSLQGWARFFHLGGKTLGDRKFSDSWKMGNNFPRSHPPFPHLLTTQDGVNTRIDTYDVGFYWALKFGCQVDNDVLDCPI